MRCEECGQSPVVSHQWRLCKDCNLEEMRQIDTEFEKQRAAKPWPDYPLTMNPDNPSRQWVENWGYSATTQMELPLDLACCQKCDHTYDKDYVVNNVCKTCLEGVAAVADVRTIFESTAEEIGRLVAEKQKAYGDSFGKSGALLKILYPDGIALDQYDDVLTIARIVDKLFRIATDKDAMGESPWRDINGYSLLAYIRDQKRGKQ